MNYWSKIAVGFAFGVMTHELLMVLKYLNAQLQSEKGSKKNKVTKDRVPGKKSVLTDNRKRKSGKHSSRYSVNAG